MSVFRRTGVRKTRRRLYDTHLAAEILETRSAPDGTPLVNAKGANLFAVADNGFGPNDLGLTARTELKDVLAKAGFHPGYWNYFVGGGKAGLQRCA